MQAIRGLIEAAKNTNYGNAHDVELRQAIDAAEKALELPEDLRAFVEKHPLPWATRADGNTLYAKDSNGEIVPMGNTIAEERNSRHCIAALVNHAYAPAEPKFEWTPEMVRKVCSDDDCPACRNHVTRMRVSEGMSFECSSCGLSWTEHVTAITDSNGVRHEVEG